MPKPTARLNGTPGAHDQAQAKGASSDKHRDRGVASAPGPALSLAESTVLALQRMAGNEAVTQLIETGQSAEEDVAASGIGKRAPSLQRWGPAAAIAGAKANIRADDLD